MQKLFGGFLLAIAGVLFFYRAWILGIIALFLGLVLLFDWKNKADGDGEFEFSSGGNDYSDSSSDGGGGDGGGGGGD